MKLITTNTLTRLREEIKANNGFQFEERLLEDSFDFNNLEKETETDLPSIIKDSLNNKFTESLLNIKNENTTHLEFKLGKHIYENIKLDISQAANNLFWTTLNLTVFYTILRQEYENELNKQSNKKSKSQLFEDIFILKSSSQNSFISSRFAGLWWAFEITVLDPNQYEEGTNIYFYTKEFLRDRNLRQKNLGVYKFIRSKDIFIGVMDFYLKYKELKIKDLEIGSEVLIQQTSKLLNQLGGTISLSYLDKDDIVNQLEKYKLTIFKRARDTQFKKAYSNLKNPQSSIKEKFNEFGNNVFESDLKYVELFKEKSKTKYPINNIEKLENDEKVKTDSINLYSSTGKITTGTDAYDSYVEKIKSTYKFNADEFDKESSPKEKKELFEKENTNKNADKSKLNRLQLEDENNVANNKGEVYYFSLMPKIYSYYITSNPRKCDYECEFNRNSDNQYITYFFNSSQYMKFPVNKIQSANINTVQSIPKGIHSKRGLKIKRLYTLTNDTILVLKWLNSKLENKYRIIEVKDLEVAERLNDISEEFLIPDADGYSLKFLNTNQMTDYSNQNNLNLNDLSEYQIKSIWDKLS